MNRGPLPQDALGADAPPPRTGTGMFRSTFAIAFYTLLSRIAGFVRDIVMTAVLGTSAGADAFFIALRLANLGRSLFAEGALNAAFVPMFSGHLEQSGRAGAFRFANIILNWLLVILFAVTIVLELLMPFIVLVFAPGFTSVPGKIELATLFSRIAFPYLLLVSLVTLLSGVLNSMGRFWVGAAVPILLNLAMIFALLVAAPYNANPALLLAWSCPVAGVVQLCVLIYASRRIGLKWRLQLPRPNPELKKLLRLLLPVALAGVIGWGSILVTSALASFQESAVSFLQYAERLYHLPLSLIGISIGVVLLPELSRQWRGTRHDRALKSQNRALEFALLLTLPAAVLLFLLSEPIINVLFERARFTASDTRATAAALSVMAWGLPGAVLAHIFVTVFYARQDTKTPLLYNAISNGVYVAAACACFFFVGYVGIAIAASLAAWTHATLLGVVLHRGGQLVLDARLRKRAGRFLASAAVMVVVVWGLHQGGGIAPLAESLGSGLLARASVLFVLFCAGLLAYAAACQLTGAAHWREIIEVALPQYSRKQEKP
ncbi:MAG: murein biosynthesis integral membrane protein MurJ [Hyphomicrobiales bacterium]|nr:murein biosynthesis integral membrane protein MurJ [Hyphomicrobiales bacterium]MCY4049125.1 murein biosynthesis integral membrane protein MurJ [Hyphomicrobiales bacterium]MCY4053679.1 murein biosynthesis integral membrane protein MurJ [Hyphomicrobiales bacterium]